MGISIQGVDMPEHAMQRAILSLHICYVITLRSRCSSPYTAQHKITYKRCAMSETRLRKIGYKT